MRVVVRENFDSDEGFAWGPRIWAASRLAGIKSIYIRQNISASWIQHRLQNTILQWEACVRCSGWTKGAAPRLQSCTRSGFHLNKLLGSIFSLVDLFPQSLQQRGSFCWNGKSGNGRQNFDPEIIPPRYSASSSNTVQCSSKVGTDLIGLYTLL